VVLTEFVFFLKPDVEIIARVDTNHYFGKERHNVFYAAIRILLNAMAEAPSVLNSKYLRY